VQFEVEQKFYVDGLADTEALLRQVSAEFSHTHEQTDTYFAHPVRDFAVTDEAFRLRSDGDENRVTYKGPRIDPTTKTRRELELPLPPGAEYRVQFASLLGLLGFRGVAEVRKRRRKAFVVWEGARIEVSLDDVLGVGTFVELELMAAEHELADAKRCLQSLANRLALTRSERRSYLCLLLEKNPQCQSESREGGSSTEQA
jgi:adenylate cyclase class 2